MRTAFLLIIVSIALASPTRASAAACERPGHLKVVVDGGRGQGLIVYRASRCALPPRCASAKASLVTQVPLTVSVSRGATGFFSITLDKCAGPECAAMSGPRCPGGMDSYKTGAGVLKLMYGADGHAAITARLRGPMSSLPDVSGPVTLTVSDSDGYVAEASFSDCRVKREGSDAVMVCR